MSDSVRVWRPFHTFTNSTTSYRALKLVKPSTLLFKRHVWQGEHGISRDALAANWSVAQNFSTLNKDTCPICDCFTPLLPVFRRALKWFNHAQALFFCPINTTPQICFAARLRPGKSWRHGPGPQVERGEPHEPLALVTCGSPGLDSKATRCQAAAATSCRTSPNLASIVFVAKGTKAAGEGGRRQLGPPRAWRLKNFLCRRWWRCFSGVIVVGAGGGGPGGPQGAQRRGSGRRIPAQGSVINGQCQRPRRGRHIH